MENTSLESLAELPLLWQPQCVHTLHSDWQPDAHVLFPKQLNVLQCQFLCVPGLCARHTHQMTPRAAAIPSQLSLTQLLLPQPLQGSQRAGLPLGLLLQGTLGARAGTLALLSSPWLFCWHPCSGEEGDSQFQCRGDKGTLLRLESKYCFLF